MRRRRSARRSEPLSADAEAHPVSPLRAPRGEGVPVAANFLVREERVLVEITVGPVVARATAVVLPVRRTEAGAAVVETGWPLAEPVGAEVEAFLGDVAHRGAAGTTHILPRPGRDPG